MPLAAMHNELQVLAQDVLDDLTASELRSVEAVRPPRDRPEHFTALGQRIDGFEHAFNVRHRPCLDRDRHYYARYDSDSEYEVQHVKPR